MRALSLLVVLLGIGVGAGPAARAAGAEMLPASAFAYDAEAPLDLKDEAPAAKRGEVTVRDVSFAAAVPGTRIRAYLVLPREAPSYSGVLWVHWLGEKNSNRDEFLGDAVELAASGTVSLLIDADWSAPRWFRTRTTDTDYDRSIRQVKDLRRSLDALLAQKGVDGKRVAYVGHDFGGMYGTILAGIDPRASYCVFIAVTTKLTDWFLLGPSPKSKADYLAKMAAIEPTPYLKLARVRAFLFQFADSDEYVTRAHAEEYANAAPGEKAVRFYAADHALDVPKAHEDRIAWLKTKLVR